MFDVVDTTFSYERELIFCSFLQDFSKGKGSSLQLICNTHTAYLLCGADSQGHLKIGWQIGILWAENVKVLYII